MNHECKLVRVYTSDATRPAFTSKAAKEANRIYDTGLTVLMSNGLPYLLWIDRRSGQIHWNKNSQNKVYEQSEYLSAFTDLKRIEIRGISETECQIFFHVFPHITSYAIATNPQVVAANVDPYSIEPKISIDASSDTIEFTLKHKNAKLMAMFAEEAINELLKQASYSSLRRLNFKNSGYRVVTENQILSMTPAQHLALQTSHSSAPSPQGASSGTTLSNIANISVDLGQVELSVGFDESGKGDDLNNPLTEVETPYPILALGLMVKKQSSTEFVKKPRFMWIDFSTGALHWCKGFNKSTKFKKIPLKLWVDDVEVSYQSKSSSFRLIFKNDIVAANQKSPDSKKGRSIDVTIQGSDSRDVVDMFSSYISSIISDDIEEDGEDPEDS